LADKVTMSDQKKIQVMVAGHLCLDITPRFPATANIKISEVFSPGKLTNVDAVVLSTGGAVSNTGLAMAKLGIEVVLNGKVGEDEIGNIIRRLVGQERAKAFKTVAEQNSSYTIVLAPPGVDRFFLHNPATNDSFGPEDIDYELARDCVLFHFGYPPLMKRMYENEGKELTEMYKRIKELGVTTSLDMAMPDPAAPSGQVDWRKILEKVLPHVDIFLPSLEEITFMMDRKLYDRRKSQAGNEDPVWAYEPADCTMISDKLLSLGVKIAAVKCGVRGLYLRSAAKQQIDAIGTARPKDVDAWADRELWAGTYKADKFASALGAGDATIAGFLCGLIREFSPEDSLQIANTVGWQNVQAMDALSGISDWPTTEKLLKNKNRLYNSPKIKATDWRFCADDQLFYGPHDKKQVC